MDFRIAFKIRIQCASAYCCSGHDGDLQSHGRPEWPALSLACGLPARAFLEAFVGQRRSMPPLRSLGPVALVRYDWMWTNCVAIGRQRRTASGRRMWIRICGSSSEGIMHMEFDDARGWVERWRIYDERQ